MINVFENVEKYTRAFALGWGKSQYREGLLKEYTRPEKRKKQKLITQTINAFFGLLNKKDIDFEDKAWTDSLKKYIIERAKLHLDIKDKKLEAQMMTGMIESTDKFIASAREYDSELKPTDIMQAMRNVWIMNLVQLAAGKDAQYTPVIFAYSMLYPYTDNFLDDPDISDNQKSEFNRRLSVRLCGEEIAAQSEHEKKVFGLIDIIESQYPREQYKSVYDSIISIQKGQIKSLEQQDGCKDIAQLDLALISAEKGGTSVLADAYLVCGDLDESLFEFAFGFGFMLQLIDDLQDVADDRDNKHMTVFSCIAGQRKLDAAVNKLIAFIEKGVDFDNLDDSPYIEDIRNLIVDNCILMIFEAVSKNRKYFTRGYMKFANRYSSLSLSYFKRTNKMIKRKMKPLMDRGII